MASGYELYNWAWGIEGLNQGEKLLLLALASYANKRGECFPTRKELARRTGSSEASVRNHIRSLRKAGLIEITSQFDRSTGRKTSSLYRLKFSAIAHVNKPVDK